MRLPLPHATVGPLAFALGVALQAMRALFGRPRPGDGKRLAIAGAIGLLGFVPGRHESHYSALAHFYAALFAFGMGFAWKFRERLLARIGARILLAWNLLTLAALWSLDGHGGAFTLVLLLPTALTVTAAFTDIDRDFNTQVLLHVWYSVMLIVIAAVEWHVTSWRDLAAFAEAFGARSIVGNVFAGAAFLYVAVNAWFVLALIPVPLRKGQPWIERIEEVQRHMKLLAWGYVWAQEDPWRSLAVLVVLPLALIANARWQFLDPSHAIVAGIALMPLVTSPDGPEGDDRVGELPGDDPGAQPFFPDTKPTGPAARRRRALARRESSRGARPEP